MPHILRKTITETFLERVKRSRHATAFSYKVDSKWESVTFAEYYEECRLLSFGLMSFSIQPGDRIALLSHTRYEWTNCDMAILGARGVTVPIYPSSTAEDVEYILNHSEAVVLILEDVVQLRKVLECRQAKPDALPFLKKIVVMEPSAMSFAAKDLESPRTWKDVLTLQSLHELGRREESRDPKRFENNLRETAPGDLLTICYTSGTTGVPKGAMLTQDNLMSVLEDCVAVIGKQIRPGKDKVLTFLPYSHILGKVESMAVYTFGWQVYFAENIDKLPTNFLEVKPTLVFAVPRIFEKAFSKITAEAATKPPKLQKLFQWALDAGRTYCEAVWARKSPTLADRARYALAGKLVFPKIREGFGGKLRFVVCGGAPLPKKIGEFFDIVGIRILEGYGLTETCAPVAINSLERPVFGAVGKPLPEVSIKIAEDGEILVRSRKVFKGYYKMPEQTAEVLSDGWFHTGDIGMIDRDGVLKITDRKKDIIITSAGKNIAPQKIENLAKTDKLIQQLVVHGDQRQYLTAMVCLDKNQTIRLAAENEILFSDYTELVKHPKIIARVQQSIDEINRHLASFETVKKFVILPHEFTIESGELTPSLKVKRKVISERYRSLLDSMYLENTPGP